MRRLLALVALLAAPGCESLIGAADKAECAADTDCPALYVCDVAAGRCHDPGRGRDLGPFDAAPLDAGARDAFVPDAFVPDAFVPAPDAEPQGFGPEGDCFADMTGEALASIPGTSIPRARCTPSALVWTAPDEDGVVRLRYRLGPGDADLTVADLALPDRPDLVVHGAAAVVPAANDGRLNIARVDLHGGAFDWVDSSASRQAQPATDGRLVAYVQDLVRGDGVSLREVRVAAGLELFACPAEDAHRWGPAVVDDRVAWFERARRGGPVELVMARADCTVFFRARLEGGIADDARLHADGHRLVWMATDPATRRRVVWTLDLLDDEKVPRRPPLSGLEQRNPVDIAVHDGRIAVSAYSPGGHVLDLYRLDDGRQTTIDARSDARQPALSGRWVLWSSQSGTGPWRIRYEALDR